MLINIMLQTGTPPIKRSVRIYGSLEASMQHVEPTQGRALAAEVARLLRWRINVNKNIHRNDQLTILYETGDYAPDLVAMRFDGEELNFRAYRFSGGDRIARYYNQEGVLIEPFMRNNPVTDYVQITDIVQRGRGKRLHKGIDLKAPEGSAITLPYPGVVKRINWSRRSNGNCIEIVYDKGYITHFLHLADIAPNIRVGAYLGAGTLLGHVGSTGRSNAAHLHYEVLSHNRPLEPLHVHGYDVLKLQATELEQFQKVRIQLDAALQ